MKKTFDTHMSISRSYALHKREWGTWKFFGWAKVFKIFHRISDYGPQLLNLAVFLRNSVCFCSRQRQSQFDVCRNSTRV